MVQKQILLANREEANYLERKGVDLSKYTRVDPKKFTPQKELDQDIFAEVCKILRLEQKKAKRKEKIDGKS